MGLIDWTDKNIFVRLNKNDLIFTGKVLEVVYLGKDIYDIDLYLFTIKDKFGKLQSFSNKEIALLQEQR